jgi:hypothetical protein
MSISLTKVFSAKPGWYRGDFHAHTTCSDGVLSPGGLKDLAVEHGLDFLSITDHNGTSAFDSFDESLETMILPGLEVTLREGHFNVFGFEGLAEQARKYLNSIVDLPRAVKNHQHKNHAELTELMNHIKADGLIVDLVHPLLWPWEWRDHETGIAAFDCIELITDPTYRDSYTANPSARRLWSAWLNAGFRVTAVGGTDFHSLEPSDDSKRVARLNLPLTYVYARELSGQAILEGVRQRHVYVSMGPQIEFQAQAGGQIYQMGEELGQVQSRVRIFARVEGCSLPAQALLVSNGKIITQVVVRNGVAEIEWEIDPGEVKESSWYRFDVIDPDDQSIAVSNPLFFGPQPSAGSSPYGRFLGAYAKA